MNPDDGLKNFNDIVNKYGQQMVLFNEAETRAKIIDYILRESLGWDEGDIKREDHVASGFTDYQLVIDGICRLVIEAKKAGTYFDIPRTKTSRTLRIGGALSTVPNLMNALNQVRKYCDDIGCKYAAVFNGYQMIIFSAITIGKPWKDGYCTIFYSLDDIKDNFSLFWNLLSREQVKGGSLVKYVDIGKSTLTFEKPIDSIHNADSLWTRNALYTYIQPISDLIFSELLDEQRTQIMKECYVFDRSNKQLGTELESYFVDTMPHFAEQYRVKEFTEREKKAGAFEKDYLSKTQNKAKGSIIVLLGGIGSGKSTFVHRFFKVVLADRANLLWFYIDFRKVSNNEQEIENFITKQMFEQWKEKYKQKLDPELEKNGFLVPSDNLKDFFSKLFGLLRTMSFSITLIIDNVDQHETSFQENLFIISSHLSNVFKTVTIIALREETFLSSTRTGVFDAYYIPKFHIASPDFVSMVLRRVRFTIKMLRSEYLQYSPSDKDNLMKYFSIIESSLTKKNQEARKLVNFIDSISVGNMRDALRMFNYFIVSGNTNIDEIFATYARAGSYQIAYHQFLKSIILGEHKYYSQEKSHLMNLFDLDTSLTDSHYHCLRILKYLFDRQNKKSDIGRGYVNIDDLISTADIVSIRKEVIRDSLLRLSHFNLVEFDNQSRTNLTFASYVKITHAGRYYLANLIYEFVYLDSVLIDTPIWDSFLRTKLQKLSIDPDLAKRLERTEIFVNYLKQAELLELKEHPEYASSDFTNYRFGESIADRFPALKKKVQFKASII